MKVFSTSLLFLLISVFFYSCEVESPDDPGGVTDEVTKFLGEWNVSDQPARLNYEVIIERDPVYSNQVFLQNFGDAGDKAVALVVDNKLIIDSQEIGSGYSAEGEGTYASSKSLTVEFDLTDGIDKESRRAFYSK